MLHPIPLDGPVDLATLRAFLASDRAPPDCMQLAELDGFLAGIIVSPEIVMPGKWLPEIWHESEPGFADLAEMQSILGIVMRRYNEIVHQLDAEPTSYRPLIATGDEAGADASDWTLGFLHAMALCQDSWLPLLHDRKAGTFLSPIMLIASTTERANLPLEKDERLPDAEMAKLLADPAPLLAMCVAGMRVFFQSRRRAPPRKRKAAKRSSPRR